MVFSIVVASVVMIEVVVNSIICVVLLASAPEGGLTVKTSVVTSTEMVGFPDSTVVVSII